MIVRLPLEILVEILNACSNADKLAFGQTCHWARRAVALARFDLSYGRFNVANVWLLERLAGANCTAAYIVAAIAFGREDYKTAWRWFRRYFKRGGQPMSWPCMNVAVLAATKIGRRQTIVFVHCKGCAHIRVIQPTRKLMLGLSAVDTDDVMVAVRQAMPQLKVGRAFIVSYGCNSLRRAPNDFSIDIDSRASDSVMLHLPPEQPFALDCLTNSESDSSGMTLSAASYGSDLVLPF